MGCNIMRRLSICLLIVSFIFLSPKIVQAEPTATKAFINVKSQHQDVGKNVRVYKEGRMSFIGSGFFIHGGDVVTAAHVVGETTKVELIDGDRNIYKADVVAVDPAKDLALIRTGEAAHKHFVIAAEESRDVIAITNTTKDMFVEKTGVYIHSGLFKISVGEKVQNETIRNRYSFTADHGNSGSALLNSQGEVVGVVIARTDADGNAVAVTVADVKSFIEDNSTNKERIPLENDRVQ